MVKDAEANAAEDAKRKELVEAKNHAEALLHSTEKTLEEYGDKISEADKSAIDAAVEELKTALEGEDTQAITDKTNTLAQAAMKLGEALYQDSQAEGATDDLEGAAASESTDAGDDVVDADFEEVGEDEDDEDKKSA